MRIRMRSTTPLGFLATGPRRSSYWDTLIRFREEFRLRFVRGNSTAAAQWMPRVPWHVSLRLPPV